MVPIEQKAGTSQCRFPHAVKGRLEAASVDSVVLLKPCRWKSTQVEPDESTARLDAGFHHHIVGVEVGSDRKQNEKHRKL
jgi:hypothetical protein